MPCIYLCLNLEILKYYSLFLNIFIMAKVIFFMEKFLYMIQVKVYISESLGLI